MQRIQSFFENVRDVRTCRPFLVPPTPAALRTEKLAVVAPMYAPPCFSAIGFCECVQ